MDDIYVPENEHWLLQIILLSNQKDDNVGRVLYMLANTIFKGIKQLKQ